MTEFHTTQLVRLIEDERAAQPEIGDVTGRVLAQGDRWVEVAWPRFRSTHRREHLEPAA